MSCVAEAEDARESGTFKLERSEIARAEALLRDIARELLRRPMEGPARELHLRALRFKRTMAHWTDDVPDAAIRQTIDELLTLHRQACEMSPANDGT
jgi:hypothetical protein